MHITAVIDQKRMCKLGNVIKFIDFIAVNTYQSVEKNITNIDKDNCKIVIGQIIYSIFLGAYAIGNIVEYLNKYTTDIESFNLELNLNNK